MGRSDNLIGYVKKNEGKLERLALHGNDLASAMALTILEKGESRRE